MKVSSQALRAHSRPSHSDTPETGNVFGMLIPELQQSVSREGYTTPTEIQAECIPHLLNGEDLLGSSQTGTGKTAAFVLPLLQRLAGRREKPRRGKPKALILAPTRELAAQISDSIRTYGRQLTIRHTVIYGGVNQMSQVKALNFGVDILVATPGRLLDLMNQGYIRLDQVEVFILDEVDRMLDMGFIHDIKRVISEVPSNRQTACFSATISHKIEDLVKTLVKHPVRVTVAPEQLTVDKIDQKVLFVGKKNKDALLISLLNDPSINKALVFTQMKHAANRVVKKLGEAGIDGAAIHGNKSQAVRTKALDGFRNGRFRVLVATDVAARGLDVDDISHVINYDMPVEAETYVHRIGRTARAGARGDAISFCCAEDRAYLADIERMLGAPVPSEKEHVYHSEEARISRQPAPPNFGRKSPTQGRRSWPPKPRDTHRRRRRR